VYSRNQIISGVKGSDYAVTERSVDVQITVCVKNWAKPGSTWKRFAASATASKIEEACPKRRKLIWRIKIRPIF
jgi:hypothetical protein